MLLLLPPHPETPVVHVGFDSLDVGDSVSGWTVGDSLPGLLIVGDSVSGWTIGDSTT